MDNFKEAFKNCINDSDETVNLKSLNVGYEDLGKTTRTQCALSVFNLGKKFQN